MYELGSFGPYQRPLMDSSWSDITEPPGCIKCVGFLDKSNLSDRLTKFVGVHTIQVCNEQLSVVAK
jgi:hypothetical protein